MRLEQRRFPGSVPPMSAFLAILRLPAVFGLLLALLVSTGCGQATARSSATNHVSTVAQAVAEEQAEAIAEPTHAEPVVEQPTTAPQPLLFADDRPEPYRPRGPPGLTFLPMFPAPLILPADVLMPGEIGIVVDRVMGGHHVVAWAAISPVGWRVGAVRTVGFRYYNPVTGRYISRDPIGYGDGLNCYLYTHNNPINRIDPLGLWEWLKDVILPVLDDAVNSLTVVHGIADGLTFGGASATTGTMVNAFGGDGNATVRDIQSGGLHQGSKMVGQAALVAGATVVAAPVVATATATAVAAGVTTARAGLGMVAAGNAVVASPAGQATVNAVDDVVAEVSSGGPRAANAIAGALGESKAVTEKAIRGAMEGATLDATQGAVSLPMVQRYYDKLVGGSPSPPIQEAGGAIVEGHHRYVAGRLFGKEPLIEPGTGPLTPKPRVPWSDVKVDPVDWDPPK